MGRNIAIIGSGPSGIYAAEALAKSSSDNSIYIIESLFCPYGLVRSGVAPDHPKIKEVAKLFDKTLARENVHFLANLEIGKDIEVSELENYFDAIIFCTGAHHDRSLGISGENLKNVETATNFVGWYNAHPWFEDKVFALDLENVAVIGQGNVAVDVSRILLKDVNALKTTDISYKALEALEKSKVKNVYMVGRRGPLQAAFTDKELRELGEIPDVFVNVNPEDLQLTPEEQEWLESSPKGLQKNYSILKDFSERTPNGESKNLHIKFFLSPVEFVGDSSVEEIKLVKNTLTGDLSSRKAVASEIEEKLPVGLVFKSVGYKGRPIKGLPFDDTKGVFNHISGKITGEFEYPKFFTSGWIKRGPSGVVGTNKADSVETVNTLLAEIDSLPKPKKSIADFLEYLNSKELDLIDFERWKLIDQEEIRRGNGIAPRKKFLNNKEALNFLKTTQ